MIVYFACQWLITVVVVWLYDDFTNAGNLALAMHLTNFFYSISAYNIRAYQVSDVHGIHSDSTYIMARLVTCTGAALLCAGFVFISGYTAQQMLIIVCYMVFRSVEAFIDVLHGIMHKHRRLDYAGISMTARGLLMLGTFSLLGWMLDLLPAIMGMAAITALFGLLYDVPRARKLASGAPCSAQQIKALLRQCFPLMLVFLFITFFASYTRYALERLHGTAALGAYTTAVTPAIALQLAVSFMLTPLTSLFSDCVKKENHAQFRKTFTIACFLIAGLTLAAVLAATLAGRWGLGLLFGADILPYTHLLPGAMIVTGLTASLWFMNVVFTTLRDLRGLFYGTAAGIVVCVAAAELFLRQFGLIGANYALITCQGVVLLVLCIRLLKRKI